MTGVARGSNLAIAQKFPWSLYQTFADIGCAQGDLPIQVALANPHLKGIGFDLPEVGPICEEYLEACGEADRVQFQGGDFFKEDLPKADVILMGRILHDWDLLSKMDLIRKVHAALPKGGSYVVHESLIDDERQSNTFGLMMSLNMLIEAPGGFDYTGADCQSWMHEAGFSETRVEPLAGPDSMVIGIK